MPDGTKRTARITVQWADGKSVHELLAEARERIAFLSASTNEAHAFLSGTTDDLAQTKHALDGEREGADDLRAIIDGMDRRPTDAEIAELEAVGGRWRCVVPDALRMCADAMHGHAAQLHRATLDALGLSSRWWALDADGRPCAWPVVSRG